MLHGSTFSRMSIHASPPRLPQPHQLLKGSLCAEDKALWAVPTVASSAPLPLIISAALAPPCDAPSQGWHQGQPYPAGPYPLLLQLESLLWQYARSSRGQSCA